MYWAYMFQAHMQHVSTTKACYAWTHNENAKSLSHLFFALGNSRLEHLTFLICQGPTLPHYSLVSYNFRDPVKMGNRILFFLVNWRLDHWKKRTPLSFIAWLYHKCPIYTQNLTVATPMATLSQSMSDCLQYSSPSKIFLCKGSPSIREVVGSGAYNW